MNQIETITQLSHEECAVAIVKLAIAPEIRDAIPGAELSGKIVPSSDGDRIILSIQLPASVRSEPIILVGWRNGPNLSGEGLKPEAIP